MRATPCTKNNIIIAIEWAAVAVTSPDRRQSKTLILSMNEDEKSLETEFSIVICRPTEHLWSKYTRKTNKVNQQTLSLSLQLSLSLSLSLSLVKMIAKLERTLCTA